MKEERKRKKVEPRHGGAKEQQPEQPEVEVVETKKKSGSKDK